MNGPGGHRGLGHDGEASGIGPGRTGPWTGCGTVTCDAAEENGSETSSDERSGGTQKDAVPSHQTVVIGTAGTPGLT